MNTNAFPFDDLVGNESNHSQPDGAMFRTRIMFEDETLLGRDGCLLLPPCANACGNCQGFVNLRYSCVDANLMVDG